MVQPQANVVAPARGVRDAQVEWLVESAVRCFFSCLEGSYASGSADTLKEDALRFHSVLHAIFAQAAVIPFRFPTVLEPDELRRFLAEGAAGYPDRLARLRDVVQMELRISSSAAAIASPPSGREYLLRRQAQAQAMAEAAAASRSAAGHLIQDWRERETRSGLRCYALVPRAEIGEFQARMGTLGALEGVTMVVSGPWPATEFLEVRVGA
jgi:hypothetical protein